MELVPNHPSELGLDTLDGKDEWRELQQGAIGQIVEAFRSKKFVFANMPTGSGKTIIGAAVAKILDARSLSLTHTIQLQSQYLKTLPWAGLMTGRGNHLCKLYPEWLGVTAANAICSTGEECVYKDRSSGEKCSYYEMFYDSVDRKELILNYAYATRILQTGALGKRQLLICDEADLVEEALVEAVRLRFTPAMWNKLEVEIPPIGSSSFSSWSIWAFNARAELEYMRDEVRELARSNQEAAKRLNRINLGLEATRRISYEVDPGSWTFLQGKDETIIRPVWGKTVAQSLLWNHGERVLLMSATLGDPKLLATKLGILEDQYAHFDFPSTFPVNNRLNQYWPIVKLNKSSGEEDWGTLVSAIEFVASHHPRQKGIIHCGSYKLGKEICDRLDDRYILQDQDNRIEALTYFTETDDPVVMVTPSFSTGLDLPYTIGWQVIAKMPFGNLGDQIVRLRRDTEIGGKPFGKQNYDAEAINTVIQACGRAVRAPDDKGVTYILDGNFWPLYKRTYTPQYFNESVRWLKKENQ